MNWNHRPQKSLTFVWVSFALILLTTTAWGQTKELQNDGWLDNTAAGFQGGFVSGEIGAVSFVPDAQDLPVRLQKIKFLFGGDNEGATYAARIKVWAETTEGAASPGPLVFDEEFEITSSTQAFNEVDFSSSNLTFEGPFRVGIEAGHNGFPNIARDNDGNTFPGRNWIFEVNLGWARSLDFLVQGDWIIRAEVIAAGGPVDPNNDPNNQPNNDTNNDPNNEPNNDGNNDVEPPSGLTVTGINPTQAVNDQDTDVTIFGTGFVQNQTVFRVGSTVLENIFVQPGGTAATARIPAGVIPGTYDVVVNDPASAEQAVLNSGFTVVAPAVAPPSNDGCQSAPGFPGGLGGLAMLLLLIGVNFVRRREA